MDEQCYAEKQALGEVSPELLDTQVNPAVWEISGHMVLKRKKDYEEASEENAWRLLAEVSLSEERFQEVTALIFEAISYRSCVIGTDSENLLEDVNVEHQLVEEVNAINESSHQAMVTGNQDCLVLHWELGFGDRASDLIWFSDKHMVAWHISRHLLCGCGFWK